MHIVRRNQVDLGSLSDYAHQVARKFGRIGVHEPEDIAQMALMKLVIRQREGATPTKGWLYTVVRSAAYDVGRRHARDKHFEFAYESPFQTASVCEHSDEQPYWFERAVDVAARATCEPDVLPRIDSALEQLTDRLHDVLALHMEGYSYSEIAQTVGTSLGTVRSRLHNARRKAQVLLGDLV